MEQPIAGNGGGGGLFHYIASFFNGILFYSSQDLKLTSWKHIMVYVHMWIACSAMVNH